MTPERVTVTMPIHPLRGQALKLVELRRDHIAQRQMVIAELADGSHMVLPVDWTDRGKPWGNPQHGGVEVKLCGRGLLRMARAVETALAQKLAASTPGRSAWKEAEAAETHDEARGSPRTGRVGGAVDDDATQCARRVGQSFAQDEARRKRGRR